VAERISAADITDADRSFLTERLSSLRASYQDLRYALAPSAVHGDAHQSNLIKRPTEPRSSSTSSGSRSAIPKLTCQ
jgi:hypothetical protein